MEAFGELEELHLRDYPEEKNRGPGLPMNTLTSQL